MSWQAISAIRISSGAQNSIHATPCCVVSFHDRNKAPSFTASHNSLQDVPLLVSKLDETATPFNPTLPLFQPFRTAAKASNRSSFSANLFFKICLVASLPTPRCSGSNRVVNRQSCIKMARMFSTLSLDRAATGRSGRESDFPETREQSEYLRTTVSHHRTRFFMSCRNSVAIFPDSKQNFNTVGCSMSQFLTHDTNTSLLRRRWNNCWRYRD